MRSEPFFHMVYASACGPRFSEAKLLERIEQGRKRNRDQGVTGMLLFADKTFFEVLEGPRPVLDALFAQVSRDPRHDNVMKLFEGPVSRRAFKEWSVGVPAEQERDGVSASNDFFQEGRCLQALDPSPTRDLLEAFRGGSWRMAPSRRGSGTAEDMGSSLVQRTREMLDQSDLTD